MVVRGALHNDTNYGWRGEANKSGNPLVGHRIPLDSIKGAADLDGIPDAHLKQRLQTLLRPLTSTQEIKAALAGFSEQTGIRRVIKEERLSVIPIHDRRTGQPYRYVKGDGNHCYEIFRRPDGRWDGEVIDLYTANQKAFTPSLRTARNGLPLMMRLRKNDFLLLELEGRARCMRVAKFSAGQIALVDHQEANVSGRTRDQTSGLKYFVKSPSTLGPLRARAVGVDVLGYINDPGFRE